MEIRVEAGDPYDTMWDFAMVLELLGVIERHDMDERIIKLTEKYSGWRFQEHLVNKRFLTIT